MIFSSTYLTFFLHARFHGFQVLIRICKDFWLIWYSTKRAYVTMICLSCIVVGVINIGVNVVGIVGVFAQPS